MSRAKWFRTVSAVLFLTFALVVLHGKMAATDGRWRELGNWSILASATLAGIGLLPLEDTLDRRLHVFSSIMGTVALFAWLGISGSPSSVLYIVIVLAGVVWVTRSVARQRWNEAKDRPGTADMRARSRVVAIIVAVTVASFFYRWLVWHRLEQTSLLFIGIPALLAILTTLLARPRSTMGMLFMVMTIALLVSGIFLGEGFICILMASPLFFAAAAIVGAINDWARERDKPSETTMSLLLLLVLLPLSLEGTRATLSFPREETVRREVVVAAPAEEVARRMAGTPRFESELPAFLRLGFPRPVAARGAGDQIGDLRVIHFAGGEGKPGDLVMKVAAADANMVEFREVSDSSHVAHWLKWETARFEWQPLADGRTLVTCTVQYRRLLDPAWYFKPWEQYAVGLSTEYLIQEMAGG